MNNSIADEYTQNNDIDEVASNQMTKNLRKECYFE
jgi:hypothetical protein